MSGTVCSTPAKQAADVVDFDGFAVHLVGPAVLQREEEAKLQAYIGMGIAMVALFRPTQNDQI